MSTPNSAAALEKQIKALAATAGTGSIELAKALWQARTLPKTKRGGPPTYDELVAMTGLSRRAVIYLVQVWHRFRDLKMPMKRLEAIGWTKLAVIMEQTEPGEEAAAMKIAEECTAKELPARLKGGHKREKKRTVVLRFTPGQYHTFRDALIENGAKISRNKAGLAGKEKAIMKALAGD